MINALITHEEKSAISKEFGFTFDYIDELFPDRTRGSWMETFRNKVLLMAHRGKEALICELCVNKKQCKFPDAYEDGGLIVRMNEIFLQNPSWGFTPYSRYCKKCFNVKYYMEISTFFKQKIADQQDIGLYVMHRRNDMIKSKLI